MLRVALDRAGDALVTWCGQPLGSNVRPWGGSFVGRERIFAPVTGLTLDDPCAGGRDRLRLAVAQDTGEALLAWTRRPRLLVARRRVRCGERHAGLVARRARTYCGELEAQDGGLSADEASRRLRRYGPNRLPEARGPSAAALLLRQVASPLMYALIAAAAVAIALGELEDGLVVLAVVVLNSLIGFAQEYRAGRAIAALADLVADPARVRRDGAWIEVPAEQVVPGDLVAIGQGDRVSPTCASSAPRRCARRRPR